MNTKLFVRVVQANCTFMFSEKNKQQTHSGVMRAGERLSCAVGHVFIDLYAQLLYSFQILFFMKVLQLSASRAGLIVLIGELSDAAMSLIAGYLGDNVNVPFLSSKIGKRKSWHLLATFLMAIGVPLSFNKCFVCDGRDQSWLPLVYFGFFSALVKICYSTVAINHLAFITNVAEKVLEFTTLVAVRFVSKKHTAISRKVVLQTAYVTMSKKNYYELWWLLRLLELG